MPALVNIEGIGEEYSDLLQASGVDTVPELAQRYPEHVAEAMAPVNERRNLVRHVPDEQQVQSWVEQAKSLQRVIEH